MVIDSKTREARRSFKPKPRPPRTISRPSRSSSSSSSSSGGSSNSEPEVQTINVNFKKDESGEVFDANLRQNRGRSGKAINPQDNKQVVKTAFIKDESGEVLDANLIENRDRAVEIQRVSLRRRNVLSQQQFAEETKGITARELYRDYDIDINKDGGYSITPKKAPVVTLTAEQQRTEDNKFFEREIRKTFDSQSPKKTTTIIPQDDFSDFIPESKKFELHVSDETLLKNISPEGFYDPSVKIIKEVSSIAEVGVNKRSVDWARKTIKDSNYYLDKSLKRDTTTELFINSPDANPEAYRTNKIFTTAESKIQDFEDLQNLKTGGILVGATALTVLTGGVATSLIGSASLSATGVATVKAIGTTAQVVYGATVVHRGGKIIKEYDSETPSATFYDARNLIAEVGGVFIGAGIVKGRTLKPESYEVKYRDTVIQNNKQFVSETGSVKTKGGQLRNVETSFTTESNPALYGDSIKGQYSFRVVKPSGKVSYSNVGAIKGSSMNFKTGNQVHFDSQFSLTRSNGITDKFLSQGFLQKYQTATGQNIIRSSTTSNAKRTFNVFENNRLLIDSEPTVLTSRDSSGALRVITKTRSLEAGKDIFISSESNRISPISRLAYTKTLKDYPFIAVAEFRFGGGFKPSTVASPSTVAKPSASWFVDQTSLTPLLIPTSSVNIPLAVVVVGSKPVSSFESQLDVGSTPSTISKPSLFIESQTQPQTESLFEGVSDTTSVTTAGSTSGSTGSTTTTTETITTTEPIVDVVTETTTEPLPNPNFSFLQSTQIVPPIPLSFPKTKGKSLRDEYFDVEVRRKGSFEKVNPIRLTRSQALDFGTAITSSRSAVSFRVINKSKKRFSGSYDEFTVQNTEGEFKKKKRQFKKKKGIFIEKEKFRIDTAGELGEITFKGLEKIRGFKL